MVVVAAAALIFGAFIVASPVRAARIWGWEHFDRLPPRRRALYLQSFRVMGVVISLAGILAAVDNFLFHQ